MKGGMMLEFNARCAICDRTVPFKSQDEYWSPRDGMVSPQCPLKQCATRERSLAGVLFGLIPREKVKSLQVHESSPAARGISLWLRENCAHYTASGYFPDQPFGSTVGEFRNEDLENQTFADATFDLVVHLDVMEHVFNPFKALEEIYRTLKPGGMCIFTAPTDRGRLECKQVAFLKPDGSVRIIGEPEYHGNPQRTEEGALVTWRYGHDFPWLIYQRTSFKQIEHRRSMNLATADMGYMNDVYVLTR
jgi:SAM-dependent methyltransferase